MAVWFSQIMKILGNFLLEEQMKKVIFSVIFLKNTFKRENISISVNKCIAQ